MSAPWATLLAGLALVLSACGGDSLHRPAHAVPSGGGFAGYRLGSEVRLEPPRFQQEEGSEDTFVLSGERPTIAGVELQRVELRVDDEGRLSRIDLADATDETERMTQLGELAVAVCEGLGTRLESFTPPPLGTPEPGQPWDPVITTTRSCEGVSGGVRVSVRVSESSASDFRNMRLSITLEAP